jgi:hypothetical protein
MSSSIELAVSLIAILFSLAYGIRKKNKTVIVIAAVLLLIIVGLIGSLFFTLETAS